MELIKWKESHQFTYEMLNGKINPTIEVRGRYNVPGTMQRLREMCQNVKREREREGKLMSK